MTYPKRCLFAPLITALTVMVLLVLLTASAARAGAPASGPALDAAGRANTAIPVRATATYSFTGYTLITPTIDGVFSGSPVDYDGTTTPGAGVKTATTPFIELKPFDAEDAVYAYDADSSGTWTPGDSLWIDQNGNGFYDGPPDQVIVGVPAGFSALVDGAMAGPGQSLAFNDVEHEDGRADNNRYDDGEDIYVIDDLGEFRGGQHVVVPDPDDATAPPIAHVYWTQDPDYLYFHNDFLADADTTFFEGGAGTPATAGFIDGDGIASAGSGVPARIRTTITATAFFTTADRVAWFDADSNAAWSPAVDALWRDSSAAVPPTYASGSDAVIVSVGAGGTLTEGLVAHAWLSPDTYDFDYSDDNLNRAWDSGEDIWATSGDERWDYNYFDNELNWLIDGDGSASAGRGTDEPSRYDGNTWFQAADRVFWFDSTDNGEWNSATDGLWQDLNGNGTYQAGTDRLLYAGTAVPENSAAHMRLLQRIAVDGDGFTTAGPGAAAAFDSYRADKMPRPFAATDNVVWLDADGSFDWTAGDALWHDGDQDAAFTGAPTDTAIVTSASLVPGAQGTRLTFANHWIGYHDGEVTYNGAYDSGEDIYASNSYFSYDDLEITPDHRYTDGEDVYDRDWLEIWVYAEGHNTIPIGDPPEAAPDYEPALRDIGFRVHLNGSRIDAAPPTLGATRTISDYDTPFGIQAAAGWGPSRGFIGPIPGDPMQGVYNRHYEYRLPRRGALSGLRVAGREVQLLLPIEEIIEIVELPDCSIWAYIRWKDIRRANNGKGFAGNLGTYATSSGEDWVLLGTIIHPPPLPLPVVKNDINDPLIPDRSPIPTGAYLPNTSFFDVFFEVPFDPAYQPTTVVVETELIGLSLVGHTGSDHLIYVSSTPQPNQFIVINQSGHDGWMHLFFLGQPSPLSLAQPDGVLNNTVTVDPPGSDPPVTAGDSGTVNPQPHFTVIKCVITPTVARPGGVITYEIIYGNAGTVLALDNVRLTDTLPLSTTGVRAYPNGAFGVDSLFDVFYALDVGPLLPGQWGRAQIAVVVSPTVGTGTWLTNTVTGTYAVRLLGTQGTAGAAVGLPVVGPGHQVYLPLILRQ